MMDLIYIWHDDRYRPIVLARNSLTIKVSFALRFNSSCFPYRIMDLVFILCVTDIRLKLTSATPLTMHMALYQSHGLKALIFVFSLKCVNSSYFPDHMIDLV